MASRKNIRRLCASLLHHARGRGFCTMQVAESEPKVFAALEGLMEPSTKVSAVSILREHLLSLHNEKQLLKEKIKLLEMLVDERQKGVDEKQKLVDEKQKVVDEKQKLVDERQKVVDRVSELRAKDQIDLLRARGLNDTRGLFEHIQEALTPPTSSGLKKGISLWEDILKANADLARCIEKSTKVSVKNVAKQALICYDVYSVLSQHIHAGKSLADNQVGQGGTIMFQRGPLSPEQVEVFLCMGAAVPVNIAEDKASHTR